MTDRETIAKLVDELSRERRTHRALQIQHNASERERKLLLSQNTQHAVNAKRCRCWS